MINKCIKKIIKNSLLSAGQFENFVERIGVIEIIMQWIQHCFLHH
jgi:hypothetical protein